MIPTPLNLQGPQAESANSAHFASKITVSFFQLFPRCLVAFVSFFRFKRVSQKKTCLSPRHSTEHPDLAKETTKTTFSVLLFLTKRNDFDLCKHEISEIHENSKIKDFCGQSC